MKWGWIYHFLAFVFAPLWIFILFVHPKLKLPISHRLGFLKKTNSKHNLWFHGASAGDVLALLPIIQKYAQTHPETEIYCTVQTKAGFEVLKKQAPGISIQALPIDAWPFMDLCFARIKPQTIILECLEIWPRMMHLAQQKKVPVLLQNARISPKFMHFYQHFYLPFFKNMAWLSAQKVHDAQVLSHWLHKDIPVRVHTKFAVDPPAPQKIAKLLQKYPHLNSWKREKLCIAGSFHLEERSFLVQTIEAFQSNYHLDLHWIVCPRYPHQAKYFESALEHIHSKHWTVIRSMGELHALYALAHVAFLGGTFFPLGGHNPLEPLSSGTHLIVGPYVQNIHELLAFIEHRQVQDPQSSAKAVFELLQKTRQVSGQILIQKAQAHVSEILNFLDGNHF